MAMRCNRSERKRPVAPGKELQVNLEEGQQMLKRDSIVPQNGQHVEQAPPGAINIRNPPLFNEDRLREVFKDQRQAREVLTGEWTCYPSQSEADRALCKDVVRFGCPDQEILDYLVQGRLSKEADLKDVSYYEDIIRKAREEVANEATRIPPTNGQANDQAVGGGEEAPTEDPQVPEPVNRVSSIAEVCSDLLAPGDEVKIGEEGYERSEDDASSNWKVMAAKVGSVKYLLRNWIPYGMLTGIIGEPKIGKSAFVLGALVEPIITGKDWFTGQTRSKPGYVIWCDTERRAAINTERFQKWGLPAERIITPFNEPLDVININSLTHIALLQRTINYYHAKLVVLDSYRGAHEGDENKSTTVNLLKALAGVCQATQTALVVVHHTKKLFPDEEVTANAARGSSAFIAAVGCVLGIERPDPQSDWRRVSVLASNVCQQPPPRGYRWRDDGKGLEFGPAPQRPAQVRQQNEQERAEDWLIDQMPNPEEWYDAGRLEAQAKAEGFSSSTLKRARKALGIESVKKGKGWFWSREETKKGS
jgi:hypothetical protein